MSGFESDRPLGLNQVSETAFELTHPLVYHGSRQTFTVPAGFQTDLASVPRVTVWLVRHYGRHTPAAVLHDYLWREEAPAGTITYRDADGLMRQAMRNLRVGALRRWLIWTGVRWGALAASWAGWRGWWRSAPAVLAISLAALPLVAPPAVTILPALLVFTVVEHLVRWAASAPGRANR